MIAFTVCLSSGSNFFFFFYHTWLLFDIHFIVVVKLKSNFKWIQAKQSIWGWFNVSKAHAKSGLNVFFFSFIYFFLFLLWFLIEDSWIHLRNATPHSDAFFFFHCFDVTINNNNCLKCCAYIIQPYHTLQLNPFDVKNYFAILNGIFA